ncbi:uncharacterized protein PG986_003514 [Apiospora aurea]|uniref:Anaphase-promoting complex, subunit CDC26 n=1 Tax=Apiospora aurea TaxID=335848 RepID=A0ABR1QRY0_9PEZI
MLRRPPTTLTLTSEDIASYEDRRAAQLQEAQLQARKQAQAQAAPRMQALYSSPRGRLHRETTPRLAAPSSPLHHQHQQQQQQYQQQQSSPLHATPEVHQGGAGLSSPPEADANDWGYGSPEDDEEEEEEEDDDDDDESDMGEPSVLDQRGQRLAAQRLAQQQQQQQQQHQQGASDPHHHQLDTSDVEEQYNDSDEDEDEEMADYDPDVAGAIQSMPRSMRPTPAAAMRQGSAEPPSRRSREPSAPAPNLAVTPVPSNHHITVTPAGPGGGGGGGGAAAAAAASQIPQAPSRPTAGGGGGGGNTRTRATRGTAASAAAASAPTTRGTRTAGAGTGYVSTRGHAAGEGRMTRSREERIGVSGAAGAAGSRRTARGG